MKGPFTTVPVIFGKIEEGCEDDVPPLPPPPPPPQLASVSIVAVKINASFDLLERATVSFVAY